MSHNVLSCVHAQLEKNTLGQDIDVNNDDKAKVFWNFLFYLIYNLT